MTAVLQYESGADGAELGAPRSFFARVEARLARSLFRLPHSVQVLLSLGSAIRIDGETLHPEMQLLLKARLWRGGGTLRAESPELARRRMRAEALRFRGDPVPLGAVTDLRIGGADGELRARHYAPDEAGPRPLLVYFHGGGFATGDLETHDEACRLLCKHGRVHVLAVDYRLAPEHPFPAAIQDACAAFAWAREHAAKLGADPSRVGVGGDSAGGNLSAVASLLAAREGRPSPAFQLLIYPAADRHTARPSWSLFAKGFLLEKADMDWYDRTYAGPTRDPRVSPCLAEDLSGLCPAVVVTAGFDPLRDEGEAYAAALEAAGNHVELRRFGGLIHGFVNMTGVSPAAHDAVLEIARSLATLARRGGG
jgi:acetyl esterase